MKKLLTLLLVAVMVLSMVCVAGAAELDEVFDDAGDIDLMNREAVAVLNGMQIIKGMTPTTFVPNGTLTRAQAAKIIACMKLGVQKAEALSAASSQFTDVPTSHWACKFVNYCAEQGIVSGVGGGKFNPDGKLTGFAFGKMVLGVAGITGEFTGAAWDKNVNKALKENELNKGVAVSSKDMNRQDACHLALNALFYGEDTDPYSTVAYDAFSVTRASAGNAKNYEFKRPLVLYTCEESDLCWDGTEMTVTASPFLIYEGGFTCGKLYTDLGNKTFDIDHVKGWRNGCSFDPNTFGTFPAAGSNVGFMCSGNGVTTEWYYDAATETYTHVIIGKRAFEIVDVTDPVVSNDGEVVTPGSVTVTYGGSEFSCECNEFTTADIGSYALCYTNGKKWREVTAIVEAFKPNIVTGELQSEDQSVKIGGKTYKALFTTLANYQDVSPYPADYIAAGGSMGDTVHAVTDANGIVYAIYS